MSGQGPYYGQAAWFWKFHPEKTESATQRYKDQLIRVISVLDKAFAGKKYLIGDKCTIADLSFVTWDMMISFIFGEEAGLELEKNYPNWATWNKKLIR